MTDKIVKTVCSLCGGCACGMEVIVNDDRVVEVRGNKEHPESKGALCAKGRMVKEFLYSPYRLQYPLKRVGERGKGKWERISWDQALNLIAGHLQQIREEYGPEAVVFHKGYSHFWAGDISPYFQRLANVFNSPNYSAPWHVCDVPRMATMFYMTGVVPIPEVEKTRCILLWGSNPAETNVVQHRIIADALKRRAKLIVVDPRTIDFARRGDLHLQVRPGTDGALALGLLRVVVDDNIFDVDFVAKWTVGFEELRTLLQDYPLERVEQLTWVPKENIRKAAHLYAETKPACIIPGNALDQHTNTSQTVRAITTLMAITGNLDTPGGNIILAPAHLAKTPLELHEKLTPEMQEKRLGHKEFLSARLVQKAHPPSVIKAILEENPYPVKAMLVLGSNPALTFANSQMVESALKKLGFLAIADIFMTRTAQLADVVLPTCTFLEQTYYATYDICTDSKPTYPGLLMLRPQVVPPLEESRPDWQIIFELARKMGYAEYFPWKDIGEAIDYELKPLRISFRDLENHPEGIKVHGPAILYYKFGNRGPLGRLLIWLLNHTMFRKYPQMYHKYRIMKFITPSKKVEILSRQLAAMSYDALPAYHEPAESPLSDSVLAKDFPLVLTAGAKLNFYVHSQMRNIPSLAKHLPYNVLEIHPETAAGLGVGEGETVLVESPRGSIRCQANLTEGIHPQVVQLFHGFDEANCNLLIDHRYCDPMTGSVPFRSSLCRVKKP